MANKGWKNKKTPIIVGTETAPTKMESGQVIINKKATKQNLDKLIEINNDGLNAEKSKVSTDGTDGGILKGKPHYDSKGNSLGGIPVIVDGGKKIEVEGEEFVVNKEASQKHWKELSKINQSAGNGVPINPSDVGSDEDPQEFRKGGTAKIIFNPNHIPNKWIYSYAKKVKEEYAKVWDMGGNIFGNEAFKNLERVIKRGYWTDNEEWMYIKWQSYVARHHKDFRIAGTVAMLKWVDKTDKGWDYMKVLIEKEIAKKYPKKGFKRKLSGGGGVNEGLQIINKTDEFGEKYDVIVNGIKQGSILKSDEEYFAMSNSTRGGKSFPSKRFDNLDKAKKYIYSKTKTIFPLNSKSIMNKMGYGEGGGVKIMPQQGTLLTKDKKLKLDYKKNGNNFEFVVYDGKTNPVANYTKTSFKKKENSVVTMDYNQFMNYIYAEGYIDDKNYDLGGGVEFVPEKKGTLIRGNEIIKYFEKVNGNYRLLFYILNESKGKVPTKCDAFGYCEELDSDNVTPKELVELIKKNNLMQYGGMMQGEPPANFENVLYTELANRYEKGGLTTSDNIKVSGFNHYQKTKKSGKFYRLIGEKHINNDEFEIWWLYFTIKDGVKDLGIIIYRFENEKKEIYKEYLISFNDLPNSLKDVYNNVSETYKEGGLIAPNGKTSNLTDEQYKLVRTPEFKAWFGDWENDTKNSSKVVDENGEPLVVYHYSKNDFNKFKTKGKIKTLTGYVENYGAYFTLNDTREFYFKIKGNYEFECFLNIINPYYTNDYRYSSLIDKEKFEFLNKNAKDGIILNHKNGEIVIFNSNQVKLADGTNTTFNANNPDIRYKEGGITDDFDYMSLFEESKDTKPTENIYEKEREEQYQKSNYSKRWASTFKEAVEKTVKSYLDAKATYEDWGSRQYKSNKGVVYSGGDDIHGNTYTIGGINEYRRKKTMAGAKMQMDEELETLKNLGLSQQEIADLIENKMEDGGIITSKDILDNPNNFKIIKSFDAKYVASFGVENGKPYTNRTNFYSGTRDYEDYPISDESGRRIRFVMMLADKNNYEKYITLSYDGYIRLTNPEWWNKIKKYKSDTYESQILIWELLPQTEKNNFIRQLLSNLDNYDRSGDFRVDVALNETPFYKLGNLSSDYYNKFTNKIFGEKRTNLANIIKFEAMKVSEKMNIMPEKIIGVPNYSTKAEHKNKDFNDNLDSVIKSIYGTSENDNKMEDGGSIHDLIY